MRTPRTRLLFVACALFLAGRSSDVRAEEEYEIKLVRAPKVGEKYELTVDGAMTRTTTMTIAGKTRPLGEEAFGVRLEGTVEVLAVNGDGEEGKIACTIKKLVRIKPDGDVEALPAGRVVTATGGKEDTTFAVDEGVLSSEASDALDLVLRMGEDDGFNDDQIYGTTEKQAVGASWPLDAKAAVEEAKADAVLFEEKAITGSLKLEKIEDVDGAQCLRIGGQTDIKQFTAKPPEGMTFDKGSLKARYSGDFPVDTTRGVVKESISVTHNARFRGKSDGGEEAVVDSKVQRATEVTRKPLEKQGAQ